MVCSNFAEYASTLTRPLPWGEEWSELGVQFGDEARHLFLEGVAVVFDFLGADVAAGREDVAVRGDFGGGGGFADNSIKPVRTPLLVTPLTPMQIRAGRAMLQWTLDDLSRESGVSVSSIRRIEGEGERSTRPTSLSAIRQALERHGLIFSDGNGISMGPA